VKYNAFISYSHDADGKLASALQSSLHRFAKPWYQIRAVRVFRDKTSLSASPALWGEIKTALAASDYFIFLASPDAARSQWVRKEIDYWLHEKPRDSLLIVVTGGKICWDPSRGDFAWPDSTALPENLKGTFSDEPKYVDIRGVKTEYDLDLSHPLFRDAVADLAATLRHVQKEDIFGEDVRQHRITKRWQLAVGSALLALTALTLVYAYQTTVQRDLARARELAAQGTLALKTDPQLAFRLAEAAIALKPTIEAKRLLWSAFAIPLQASLIGHTDPIHAIAYSPMGTTIATAGLDGEILVWNAQNGSLITRLVGHQLRVSTLSFSTNDASLLSGSADGTVRLWDIRTGQATQVDVSEHGTIVNAQFDHDGNILIISEDGSMFGWDGKGEVARLLSLPNGLAHAAVSPNGKLIVACRKGKIAVVWARNSGKLLKLLERHTQDIHSLAFSPDSRWIVTASADGTALIWDLVRERDPIALTGHYKAIEHAAFSPNSDVVITASLDGTVRLWATRSGAELLKRDIGAPVSIASLSPTLGMFAAVSQGKDSAQIWRIAPRLDSVARNVNTVITNFAFSPDGKTLAIGGVDGAVYLVQIENTAVKPTRLGGHRGAINDLSFFGQSPLWLLSNSTDGTINKSDATTGELVHKFFAARAVQNRSASFSPDGSRILTSSDSEPPVVWDTATEKPLVMLDITNSYFKVQSMAAKADHIAAVDSADHLRLWNGTSGVLIRELKPRGSKVLLLATSPDDKYLVAGTTEGDLRVWSNADGERVADLPHNGNTVLLLAFSNDGALLATAATDEKVRIWNLNKKLLIHELDGKIDNLTSLQFAPKGAELATSSNHGEIQLWDIESGQSIARFDTDISHLTRISFSPNGHHLAASSLDGEIRIFPGTTAEVLKAASSGHGRQLRQLNESEKKYFRLTD
jgi:WD40 repeat protein